MERFTIAQLTTQVNNGASSATETTGEIFESIKASLGVLTNFVISLVSVFVFFLMGKLLSRRIRRALQEAQGDTLQPDLVDLIDRLAVFGSIFVGLSIVLQFIFEIDFLQILGFFSLGISFAFKDLLSNLIAGAVIILQNRFRVNDFVQVGVGSNAIKGKIMQIQTRATILKAIDGTEIVIPNAELMLKPVVSFTAHHRRRIAFKIGISFESDIQRATDIALEVVQAHSYVLKSPKPHVIVTDIGESSVNLSVRFYIDPHDKSDSWIKVKSKLLKEVKEAYDQQGIIIPFPVRDIHMSSDESKLKS